MAPLLLKLAGVLDCGMWFRWSDADLPPATGREIPSCLSVRKSSALEHLNAEEARRRPEAGTINEVNALDTISGLSCVCGRPAVGKALENFPVFQSLIKYQFTRNQKSTILRVHFIIVGEGCSAFSRIVRPVRRFGGCNRAVRGPAWSGPGARFRRPADGGLRASVNRPAKAGV